MALATLTINSSTLVAAQWSDGIGFAANAELAVIGGATDIVTAVDQNGTNIESFVVGAQFSGNIGTAAAPLRFTASDGSSARKSSANSENFVRFLGGNTIYLNPGASGIDNLLCGGNLLNANQTANTVVYLTIDGTSYTAQSSAVATNVEVWTGRYADAASSSNTFTSFVVYGGSAFIQRGGTTLEVISGTVDYNGTSASLTNVYVRGGLFRHISGSITNVYGLGGTTDFTKLSGAVTVTNYYSYAGHTRKGKVANQGGLLTITNDILYEGAAPDEP